MPALTIKNMPEPLYERLKLHAAAHHRSMNGELLYCLEQVLMPQQESPTEHLKRVRALREGIETITASKIQEMISTGRE